MEHHIHLAEVCLNLKLLLRDSPILRSLICLVHSQQGCTRLKAAMVPHPGLMEEGECQCLGNNSIQHLPHIQESILGLPHIQEPILGLPHIQEPILGLPRVQAMEILVVINFPHLLGIHRQLLLTDQPPDRVPHQRDHQQVLNILLNLPLSRKQTKV